VHHPAYVGDAAYGRQRGDPTRGRDRRGHIRTRRVPEGEVLVIRDHHEPFISRWDHTSFLGAELSSCGRRKAETCSPTSWPMSFKNMSPRPASLHSREQSRLTN